MVDRSESIRELIENRRTLVLATVDDNCVPLASYAPYVFRDGAFHVFLSALAAHTANVASGRELSVMVIEDEAGSDELFARRRLTFRCRAGRVDDAVIRDTVLDEFERRLGDTVATLRALPDFALFRIELLGGSYVEGFGRAYAIIDPGTLDTRHIRPDRR